MMIKRFQVTLESFAWGEKHKVAMSNNLICHAKVGYFVFRFFFFGEGWMGGGAAGTVHVPAGGPSAAGLSL